MTNYGVTIDGFVAKTQQQVISELNAQFQSTFGSNINLGAQSIFGQLIGIFSEREALLWALAEAVYNSQYPSGAEGTSVDNILALNNLKRLTARATVTNPSPVTLPNGVPLYGLVLYGTAGTTVPAGSTITANIIPPKNFTLDAPVAIAAAANSTQSIYYSNNPDNGSFKLVFTGSGGNDVSTPYIPYNTDPTLTYISWTPTPTTGKYVLMLNGLVSTTLLDYTATAAAVTTAIRAIDPIYSGVTVTGDIASGFVYNWGSVSQPTIALSGSYIGWTGTPTPGTFTIRLNGAVDTVPLSTTATPAVVQAAIRQAGGANYASVLVGPYAVAPVTTGWAINWMSGSTATIAFGTGGTGAPQVAGYLWTVINPSRYSPSLTQLVNGTFDPVAKNFPYTDVAASGAGHPFILTFGDNTPLAGQPSSASVAQPQVRISNNNMVSGGNATNISTAIQSQGHPAQGTGTATCTTTGPISVLAGQLNGIGTPVSGWTGVTNQLDCIPGANAETDNEALQRRLNLLSSPANGTLSSIVARVTQVPGVTEVRGFQNTIDAALQFVTLSSAPVSGSFTFQLPSTVTTALNAGSITASSIQAAIRAAMVDFNRTNVIGSVAQGFLVDFNGAQGGQYQPLMTATNNTTGVTISTRFDRAPKSFEIVVDGGQPNDIATAIQAAQPAGIASYGTGTNYTTATTTAGSAILTSVASTQNISIGQAVFGAGMPTNALVASIGTGTVTLSMPVLSSGTGVAIKFGWAAQITDQFGNANIVNFSRPIQVPLYVSVSLTTDQYIVPGNSSSGLNPSSVFAPTSISTIQSELVAIANAVPIGGVVVGYGTNGLIGAFNNVPGIMGYTLFFGIQPSPSTNTNIQLMPIENVVLETFNISVQYT